jgi:predicted dehydrogenase
MPRNGNIRNVAVTTQNPIRVAVIGTGSLGQHHARIYAEMAAGGAVQFAGVYDQRMEVAQGFASKYQTRAFHSIEEAAQHSDALNIVTPTITHFDIARQLLALGKDLLIEKPLTDDLARAKELVQLGQRSGRLIQVGHIERFNPVVTYLESHVTAPRFIEAQRLSPHPGRGADVGVVLDLMIHDIDIVLALVKAPLVSVDAVGVPVLSPCEDIANARLRFANGCVAQLTASRVSAERLRKVRVYDGGPAPSYLSLDYREQSGSICRVTDNGAPTATVTSEFAGKRIVREPVPITKEEPLKLELQHFVECVRSRQRPLVDGEAAIRALELAFEITRQIASANAKVVKA